MMARCGSGCLHERLADKESLRREDCTCDGSTGAGACTDRDGPSVEKLQGPRS
jgi:hypothetical protein